MAKKETQICFYEEHGLEGLSFLKKLAAHKKRYLDKIIEICFCKVFKKMLVKKILFAGGSHADIPQILEAKKKGYHVITTGTAKNDLGHSMLMKVFI